MASLLILRLSALGDVLHTLPAVADLRASLDGVRFGWAVETPYADLVSTLAPVDEVIPLATRRWRTSPLGRQTRSEVRLLRRRLRAVAAGEASVDFQGLVKSSSLGWMSGARLRFGFAAGAIRERAALLFLNRRIGVQAGKHVIELNRELARGVVDELGRTFREGEPIEWARFAADPSNKLAELGLEEAVVLVPGAGRPEKQWNIDRFRSLASFVGGDLGRRVIVAWGPGELPLAEAIVKDGMGALAPQTDLRELTALLLRARLVVAGDTGPLHLAAATGTDVIGLYGPTDPGRNGPVGQIARCVESWSGKATMDSIPAENVIARVREVLG